MLSAPTADSWGDAAPGSPRVAIIGGPDVDARIELMRALGGRFALCAMGTRPALAERFAAAGFGYRPYRIGARANPLADLRGLGELVALLRRLRPQIVHAFATRPCVWGRIAARLARVPVIVGTLPGLGSLYAGDSPRVRAMRAIYRPLQRLACRVSDRTIFQNADDLGQFVAEGMVPRARALVVPGSGVPTAAFAPERVPPGRRAALRAELGLPPDAIVVTMVARLLRSKGVPEFAAAAERLGAADPRLRFLLVGPLADDSVDRLSAPEIAAVRRSVRWPGARRDIPDILASSDIFVLPSTYREGIPRVLIEAAAMGLPIVTTDTPGCRDAVAHLASGLLIAPGDVAGLAGAVAHLADRPELRRSYGRAARRLAVDRFDLAVIAGQTGALYTELLALKGLPTGP